MTTVAYRDGILAADTRCVRQGIIEAAHKLFRLDDGSIAGFAGSLCDIHHFVRWYNAGADVDDPPKWIMFGDNDEPVVDCILVSEDGVSRWTAHIQPSPIIGPYFAIGSGQQFATAAMFMGATAEQAVRVAMGLDPNTGGEVQTMSLSDGQ